MRNGAKGAPEGKERGRGASALFPPSLRPPRKRAAPTKRRRFLCARARTRAARALLAPASPPLPSQATLECERLGRLSLAFIRRLSLALDPSGAALAKGGSFSGFGLASGFGAARRES